MVEKVLCGLVVRVAVHLISTPGGAPDNSNNDVNKQFIIRNVQIREPAWYGSVEIFISFKVEVTNPRSSSNFTFSGSIQCNPNCYQKARSH